MPLKLNISGKVVCARLSGEIDHHSAKALREEIDDVITRVQPELLELDFSAVSFMDSSGIGLILGRARLLSGWGGKLLIASPSEHVRKILKLSGLERMIKNERKS